jgi:uncharacterized cupredoxin-like copper-binding protein
MRLREAPIDAVVFVVFGAALGLALALIAVEPVISAPVRVEIGIRYSRFIPASLEVPHGRPVTFVLRNDDPIDHEWMIGDAQMHERHRTGTEPYHDSRPTEVSIPALTSIETTVTFDEPVGYRYICHLPGHEAYGMVGYLTAR